MKELKLQDLKEKSAAELIEFAKENGVENASSLRKQELYFAILQNLADQDIEIEYVSPLAKAQKTQELSSVMRGIEIFGSLQNVAPVFDYLDVDGLVDHIKDVLGLPAKVMRSKAEVQKIQQDKQQQQIEQAELQQAQQVAESAGKIAPALKAGLLSE